MRITCVLSFPVILLAVLMGPALAVQFKTRSYAMDAIKVSGSREFAFERNRGYGDEKGQRDATEVCDAESIVRSLPGFDHDFGLSVDDNLKSKQTRRLYFPNEKCYHRLLQVTAKCPAGTLAAVVQRDWRLLAVSRDQNPSSHTLLDTLTQQQCRDIELDGDIVVSGSVRSQMGMEFGALLAAASQSAWARDESTEFNGFVRSQRVLERLIDASGFSYSLDAIRRLLDLRIYEPRHLPPHLFLALFESENVFRLILSAYIDGSDSNAFDSVDSTEAEAVESVESTAETALSPAPSEGSMSEASTAWTNALPWYSTTASSTPSVTSASTLSAVPLHELCHAGLNLLDWALRLEATSATILDLVRADPLLLTHAHCRDPRHSASFALLPAEFIARERPELFSLLQGEF